MRRETAGKAAWISQGGGCEASQPRLLHRCFCLIEATRGLEARSAQEGKASLAEARPAPEDLPGTETEAQPSASGLRKASSVDDAGISDSISGKTWDGQVSESWSATTWVSEEQMPVTRAQAWETRALEAQVKSPQFKQSSVEVTLTSTVKRSSLKERVQAIEEEDSSQLLARPLWHSKSEYILAQLGYSVRPADLWRFVFLWLHKGGCSFFIIYIAMLFLIGIPLLFLEMAVGQAMGQGSMDLWKTIGPWVGGVGYTIFMVCFLTSTYTNVVNTWILFYLSQSFQFPVPWEMCPLLKNSSDFDPECTRTTPFLYFWYRQTLEASDSIGTGGPPVFHLSLPLFFSWFLVSAVIINGLKSTGKAMYILVPVPYLIILCFLIRSFQLEGSMYGLQHLAVMKTSVLYNVTVWCLAGHQVLFDLGLGFGPVVSLSSYLSPSNNCLRDAFVLALIKVVTLVLVTAFILCLLGISATVTTHRCCEKNVETLRKLIAQGVLPPSTQLPANLWENPTSVYHAWLNDLPQQTRSLVLSKVPECSIENQFLKIEEGPRFAFLTFVEATSFLPGSVLWSVIFFLMLLAMGLGTAIGFTQGIITMLQDTFSSLRTQPRLLTGSTSFVMFLCGLFFTRPPGVYFVRLLSEYWTVFPIIIIIICENTAVAWAYGAKRFLEDVGILLGHPVSHVHWWLWCFVSPVVLLVLFLVSLVHLWTTPATYVAWDSDSSLEVARLYPHWALLLMVLLLLAVVLPVPVYLLYCVIHKIPSQPKSQDRLVSASESPRPRGQPAPR